VSHSTFRAIKGAFDRRRRAIRRAVLEPLLVGRPTLRDTVMNALSARGHLVFCDLGDAKFFVDPGDRVVGAWSMWHGGWQRRELEQAVSVLQNAGRLAPQSVFVDVGANIGTHSVYALRTGEFSQVVAFEPEPHNFRLLEMNFAANGLTEMAQAIAKAAGASAGMARLHLHPRNKGAHAIAGAPSDDSVESIAVPVVRVDEALTELGIAPDRVGLVWVDVEGYEPQVLRGLAGLMRERVPIAFEYSPERYAQGDWQEIARLLATHYAAFHLLSGDPTNRAEIAALASLPHADDVLVF
jgi:FkbM family methyltransferase